MDVEKLKKLLMLTNSDYDSEALSALRMANSILKKNDLAWTDLVIEIRKKSTEPSTHKNKNDAREITIENIFDYIFENAPDWFETAFVDSLYEQWDEGSDLSQKQLDSLIRIYQKIKTLVENAHRRRKPK